MFVYLVCVCVCLCVCLVCLCVLLVCLCVLLGVLVGVFVCVCVRMCVELYSIGCRLSMYDVCWLSFKYAMYVWYTRYVVSNILYTTLKSSIV